MKTDLKSLVTGAVLGAVVVLSVAAATTQPPIPEVSGLRFVILDITREGEPVGGQQRAVLRLARFYGKIDRESLDFRLKHETQELRLVTSLDVASTIRTNDIIGLQAYEHTKLSPGSRVVTHLPPPNKPDAGDGRYEIVLDGEHVVFDKAETVSSQIVIRDLGVKKMIAPDLYWGLSVVWDGKEYKRDPKHIGRWNGPWEIMPKTAWRTGFSLSEYLVPAEVLTAGRHTIALKDAFAESNTLTVFIEPKNR